MRRALLLLFIACLAVSCGQPPAPAPAVAVVAGTPTPVMLVLNASITRSTVTPAPIATATHAPTPTQPAPTAGPTPTLAPNALMDLPVVPDGVSEQVRLIYQMGLMKGSNPRAYSKVGDCNTTMPYFMGDYDLPSGYDLGDYGELQDTVDYFAGSHGRVSLAAKQGLTAHAVLSMLWNTWEECESYETPLTCEYRIHRPMYAIISFGTNDANGSVDFEKAMRRVIDMTIGSGVIPILATKADNAEGDNSFNRIIVQLAAEYQLPVWNYWRAVQILPDHGMRSPEHLSTSGTSGLTDFTGDNLSYGWNMRNLTALQALDAVRRAVETP